MQCHRGFIYGQKMLPAIRCTHFTHTEKSIDDAEGEKKQTRHGMNGLAGTHFSMCPFSQPKHFIIDITKKTLINIINLHLKPHIKIHILIIRFM